MAGRRRQARREITELKEDKQGIAITLALPEDDESQIREQVSDQIPIDDLKSLDGFTVLINLLDVHLAKEDLSDRREKLKISMNFTDFRDNL